MERGDRPSGGSSRLYHVGVASSVDQRARSDDVARRCCRIGRVAKPEGLASQLRAVFSCSPAPGRTPEALDRRAGPTPDAVPARLREVRVLGTRGRPDASPQLPKAGLAPRSRSICRSAAQVPRPPAHAGSHPHRPRRAPEGHPALPGTLVDPGHPGHLRTPLRGPRRGRRRASRRHIPADSRGLLSDSRLQGPCRARALQGWPVSTPYALKPLP